MTGGRDKKILPHLQKRAARFPEDHKPPRDRRRSIRRALAAAALMVALIALYPLIEQQSTTPPRTSGLAHVTACDRLASHPADTQKIAPAVGDDAIDVARALRACGDALKQEPADGRTLYHLARVEIVARDTAGMDHLRQSAAAGYAQAQFALGQVLVSEDHCAAAQLLVRAARQRHFYAKLALARNFGSRFADCKLEISAAEITAMLSDAATLAITPEEQQELDAVRATWPRE